jgi:phage anti-repressor protein
MVTTNAERFTQVYPSYGFIDSGTLIVINQGGEEKVLIPVKDVDALVECVKEVRDRLVSEQREQRTVRGPRINRRDLVPTHDAINEACEEVPTDLSAYIGVEPGRSND